MIHPTALIDPQAQLDASVSVGAYTVIGPHVKIGAGSTVAPHCVIEGHTTIGRDNRIFQFASLGAVPQDKKYAGEPCQLAGHVEVGDWVILGGFTTVHQFVRIGAHGMTSLNAMLVADQPPFVMSQGQPARARSMNFEGLRRRGFSPERIAAVKAMHKALYRDGLTLEQAKDRIAELAAKTPTAAPDVAMMLEFLGKASPERGIVR